MQTPNHQHVPRLAARLARRDAARTAFTLVELLITMAIIAILAGLLLGAMSRQETARESKTRSTIAKLHTMIMARYESYQTRRVPVDVPAGMAPKLAAKRRLDALRELMRLEMPERYTDITDIIITPAQVDLTGTAVGTVKMARPSISQAYLRKVLPAASGTHQGAECLYLILTVGQVEEETETQQFSASEIGDVDKDGMPEIIDAWGQPIQFLRWAPGFVSELQDGGADKPDPFDPRHVYPSTPQPAPAGGTVLPTTFALFPLIYSAGPDKKLGIESGANTFTYTQWNNNPFIQQPGGAKIGDPADFPGEGQAPETKVGPTTSTTT